MRSIRLPSIGLIASLTLLCGLVVPVDVAAGAGDPAALLPEDTLLYVAVTDIGASREALKKTSLWGLYKDPAMQAFIEPAEKAVRKMLDEKVQELWESIEVDNPPAKPPWPTGRVVLAVRLDTSTRRIPIYDWQNMGDGPPKVKEWKEVKTASPQFVVLAEMGENMDALKEIIDQAVEKAIEEGMQRKSETVRGVEMQMISPKPMERPKGMPEGTPFTPPEPNPLCYALTADTAMVSSNQGLLKDVLARLGGAEDGSLADNAARKNTLRRLGAPGDLTVYLNVPALIEFFKSMAPASELENVERMVKALGFDNVSGLGVVAKIAGNDKQELSVKGLLAVQGERRGVLDLLGPKSTGTAGNRLLTKGLASFMVANYEFGTFYEKIRQIVIDAGGPDITQMVQPMMMATVMTAPEGTPPVDLQGDVLRQLAAPLVIRTRISKPYTDPNASKTMITLGAQDPQALASGLGRLHETFIAQGNKEMRRDLLNTDIFLIPDFGQIMMMAVGFGNMSGSPQTGSWAIAVAGSNLVIGPVSGVEQEIRDLRRTDTESIQTDPMYQYAAASLPDQAGVWFYVNQQMGAEMTWQQLKAAARQNAETPGPAGDGTTPFSRAPAGIAAVNPMNILIETMKNVCDFNALPDFQAVKKYFGPSVGHVKSIDEGIYFEALGLKAPPAEPE